MIFTAEGHIEMIRSGLALRGTYVLHPGAIIKTQTRRVNRGHYKLEAERKKPHKIGYAVQRKRGAKGEPDIRIVMDRIWEELPIKWQKIIERDNLKPESSCKSIKYYPISKEDAWAEGGYSSEEYEKIFREINPKWADDVRYGFEFHCVEVRKNAPGITAMQEKRESREPFTRNMRDKDTMKYDIEWLKFKIILWLDNKYDDACWANLVMWSIGGQSFKETFGAEGNWREQSCTNINGDYAYCGKCVRTGRLKE